MADLFLILSSALYKRRRKSFLRFLNETTISRFCNCPALFYSVGVVIFVAETTSRSGGELRSPLCTVLSILLNSKVCVMLQKSYALELLPFISYMLLPPVCQRSVNLRMNFWCLQTSQKANQIFDRFLP